MDSVREVRLASPTSRRVQVGLWVFTGVVGAGAVVGAILRGWDSLPLGGLVFLAFVVPELRKRRDLVADAAVIQNWRRGSAIAWTDIDTVLRPGRFDDLTSVRLTDGTTRTTDFPASYAEQLAAVGGKPLVD